ncbi:MAG TPA: PepSY domain-containing protein [Alphaproteobacteria bacterium]
MRFVRTMLVIVVMTGAAGTARAGWFSDELPPATAKPLSEILKVVEDKGYRTITEVEFDDGAWKIKAHQPDGKEVHIKVDALSGAIH